MLSIKNAATTAARDGQGEWLVCSLVLQQRLLTWLSNFGGFTGDRSNLTELGVPHCLLVLQVCGITNAADAQYAVLQGADLIGEE